LLSGAEGGRTPLVVTELTCLNDRVAEGAVLSTDSGGPKEPLLAGGRIFLWKGMDNLGGGISRPTVKWRISGVWSINDILNIIR